MASSDRELGEWVIREGALKDLRSRLGFPRMLMAEMLYTTIAVYNAWESKPTTKIRPRTAERIGRLYRAAERQLAWLEEEGIDLTDLVPFHQVASHYRMGQEVLHQRYRNGELDALDLGILGLWVKKVDLK
jgi:hypothetical protein